MYLVFQPFIGPNKRSFFLLLVTICFFAGCGTPVSDLSKVIGRDDRVALVSYDYPYNTVGQVYIGDSACSAFLIGPRHIMTAAHCLDQLGVAKVLEVGGRTVWLRKLPKRKTDRPAFYPNVVYNEFGAKAGLAAEVYTGAFIEGVTTESNLAEDWAVVVLDRSYAKQYTPLSMYTEKYEAKIGTELISIGYPEAIAKAKTPSYQDNCKVTGNRVGKRVLLHNCDTSYGSSGGVLLKKNPKSVRKIVDGVETILPRYHVVAVHGGRYFGSNNRAVSLSSLVGFISKKFITPRKGNGPTEPKPEIPPTKASSSGFSLRVTPQ